MNVCTYVYTDGILYIVLKNNRHTEGVRKTKLVLRNNLMRLEDCGDIMNDTYLQIWCKIASSKPCLGCINSKKFMESTRLDIIHSRKLLKL